MNTKGHIENSRRLSVLLEHENRQLEITQRRLSNSSNKTSRQLDLQHSQLQRRLSMQCGTGGERQLNNMNCNMLRSHRTRMRSQSISPINSNVEAISTTHDSDDPTPSWLRLRSLGICDQASTLDNCLDSPRATSNAGQSQSVSACDKSALQRQRRCPSTNDDVPLWLLKLQNARRRDFQRCKRNPEELRALVTGCCNACSTQK